jgi:hypothetical protein
MVYITYFASKQNGGNPNRKESDTRGGGGDGLEAKPKGNDK